jgi:hypothetical protein
MTQGFLTTSYEFQDKNNSIRQRFASLYGVHALLPVSGSSLDCRRQAFATTYDLDCGTDRLDRRRDTSAWHRL